MGVALRKIIVLRDREKKQQKTFTASKHNFKRHFGII